MKHRTPIAVAVVIVCGVYLSSSLVSSQDDPSTGYDVWTNNAADFADATPWTVYDAVADYLDEVDAYADPTARDHVVGVAQFWRDTSDWNAAVTLWANNLSAEDAAQVLQATSKLHDALTDAEQTIRAAQLHWLRDEPYDALFDAMSASSTIGGGILHVEAILSQLFPPPPPERPNAPQRAATPLPPTSERTPARVLQLLGDD